MAYRASSRMPFQRLDAKCDLTQLALRPPAHILYPPTNVAGILRRPPGGFLASRLSGIDGFSICTTHYRSGICYWRVVQIQYAVLCQ
jgi:hypothetical protein